MTGEAIIVITAITAIALLYLMIRIERSNNAEKEAISEKNKTEQEKNNEEHEETRKQKEPNEISNEETLKPYGLNKKVLTERELNFYKKLITITRKNGIEVFTKIRIADFIHCKDEYKNYYTWFNKINRKHVDFLLCNSESEPILAIELDDSTHEREEGVLRDSFIDAVYQSVKLDIIHIREYSEETLEEIIMSKTNKTNILNTDEEITEREIKKENCPICKNKLVKRTNATNGNKFYGCSAFPKCKFTKTIQNKSN